MNTRVFLIKASLPFCLAGPLLASASSPALVEAKQVRLTKQVGAGARLSSAGVLDRRIVEPSGICRSQRHEGVYWCVADSQSPATIYPFDSSGRLLATKGIAVDGATNIDWETVIQRSNGELIIGDIGNNRSTRKSVVLYFIDEPDPKNARSVQIKRRMVLRYPNQTEFPPAQNIYDCDSIFEFGGYIYFLTKTRSIPRTDVYRVALDSPANQALILEKVGDISGMGTVTDCAVSPDGKRLAVLTFSGIWLFELTPEGDWPWGDKARYFGFRNPGCEAVTFDGPQLLVVSEDGHMYRIDPEAAASAQSERLK